MESEITDDYFLNGSNRSKQTIYRFPPQKKGTQKGWSYIRKAHFREVLAQRKGEGGIPKDKVIELVEEKYKQFKFEPKEATEDLTLKFLRDLRSTLKEKELPNQYEHAVQISCNISKKLPKWQADGELKDLLETMFNHANAAWNVAPKEVKKKRYSFPNYKV